MRPGRRALPHLATGLALLLVGTVLSLFLYDGPRYLTRDLEDPDESVRVAGPLLKGSRAVYRFRAPTDWIAGLDIQWAAYARSNPSTLTLKLRKTNGGVIVETSLEADRITDFGFARWRFEPRRVGKGKELALELSSPDADDASCLGLLVTEGPNRAEIPLSFELNGQGLPGSLPLKITAARKVPPKRFPTILLAAVGLIGLAWLTALVLGPWLGREQD